MTEKRLFVPHRNKLRNLTQYKDLTDEEFNEIYEEKYGVGIPESEEKLAERVEAKLQELSEDYDLDGMKANDMMQLNALVLATMQLEDVEQLLFNRREMGINEGNIIVIEKLNKIASTLRSDVSTLSSDLQLTRKIRASSKEVSVQQRWSDLSKEASAFYEKKMLYIFCPDCRMILSTVWLSYPKANNQMKLNCSRCKTKHTIDLAPLYETDNKNIEDIIIP